MCYDVRVKMKLQAERSRYWNDKDTLKIIDEKLKHNKLHDLFHASGFAHPKMLIYTNQEPHIPAVSQWGLVPFWVKDETQKAQIWNKTINARGETVFEKPAFRESAKSKRCLIYVEGFFEHHHHKGKTYPFYIHRKDELPLIFAGLWSEWGDQQTGELLNTFAIVTTKANPLMAKIHNNPKLPEPRMPVIFDENFADEWLRPEVQSDSDKQILQALLTAYPEEKLDSYTVGKLRGKEAVGNLPEANKPVAYPELEMSNNQRSLF
ncbi:SOS response-associated peptidase [Sunxiuqinia sp. sy24]|uniref:SOS response-associated peptidase n=1 Tax=Sunxiuqinia sp. sy24 TaxID=3461495 RepID=UPI0040452948